MNLQPWQIEVLQKMSKYKGKGIIQITGRQMGKSMFSGQALKRLMEDLMNRPVEDLVLAEARFAGARYYTVEPVGGNWMDMEVWCIKTFGPSAEVWDIKTSDEQFIWPELGRWYKNDRKFWFRSEADRTMFVLKWR